MTMKYEGKTILITGAGGFLGQELVKKLLEFNPKSIRALGHSEFPLYNLMQKVGHDPRVRMILRDITDKEGMKLAIEGVDILIHTAAIKSIDLAHYNAIHAINTNVQGTINIVECALNSPSLERMVFISSDKACNPVSLYGATKLVGEHVIRMAGSISKDKIFCTTRSGNFYGSSMSVIPLWNEQAKEGKPLTITDPDMKRHLISIRDMVDFVLRSLSSAKGGEIFIPGHKIMKEHKMIDIANRISRKHKIVGARPGERMREPLWTEEEESCIIRTKEGDYILKSDL